MRNLAKFYSKSGRQLVVFVRLTNEGFALELFPTLFPILHYDLNDIAKMTYCFNTKLLDECDEWKLNPILSSNIYLFIYLFKLYLPSENNTNFTKIEDLSTVISTDLSTDLSPI